MATPDGAQAAPGRGAVGPHAVGHTHARPGGPGMAPCRTGRETQGLTLASHPRMLPPPMLLLSGSEIPRLQCGPLPPPESGQRQAS